MGLIDVQKDMVVKRTYMGHAEYDDIDRLSMEENKKKPTDSCIIDRFSGSEFRGYYFVGGVPLSVPVTR